MNNDLEIFNYFVDDLLLMQYLFNSLDLDLLKNMDSKEEISVA